MTTDNHRCSVPCTLCGTLTFDDMQLDQLYDTCVELLPHWQEYLADEQVVRMNSDGLRDPRVTPDTTKVESENE